MVKETTCNEQAMESPPSEGYDMMPTIKDINSEINECHAMIDHYIQLGNKTEIKYWRMVLQYTKNQKKKVLDS